MTPGGTWKRWTVAGVVLACVLAALGFGGSSLLRPRAPARGAPVLDIQNLRILYEAARRGPAERQLECDILVAGGGLGGAAAALGACERGRTVVLTEETDWLGGQIASQGVAAPDDHRYIESFGGTRLYYALREAIRDFYRSRYALSPLGQQSPYFSPGRGWVSRLTFEPRAGAAAIREMLDPFVAQGQLTILLRHKAVRAEVAENRVTAVEFRNLESEEHARVQAEYVLDATEMGDLLPLTGTEYAAGAETRAETGEPTAREDRRRIDCAQSFAYPFALELNSASPRGHRPASGYPGAPRGAPVPKPKRYDEFRQRQPYTFAHDDGSDHPPTFKMFRRGPSAGGPFWTYRRAVAAENFTDPVVRTDRAVVLFAGNDYHWGWLLDQPAEKMLATLKEAKDLALGFAWWLQHDVPRDEGGAGYPELQLRPDVMGSSDGLSKFPYIRESRRIVPIRRILEQEIGRRYHPEARAAIFKDSVGIGWHGIDIHPGVCMEALAAQPTRPFQIPLGAFVPQRLENLLPACKNLGTTHITSGAYRMHPIEWSIGEAAGRIAAFCLENQLTPRQVARDARQLRRLQAYLVSWGMPLYWLVDVPLDHPAFTSAQLLTAWGYWKVNRKDLNFRPDRWIGTEEARALLAAGGTPANSAAAILLQTGLTQPDSTMPAAELARAWLAVVYPPEG